MATQLFAQFTENGEPIIPAEWWAVSEFDRLRSQHDRGYMRVIVLLMAYRSPYRNPARGLAYKQRVELLFADWTRRWGAGFIPRLDVLTTDTYQQAEKLFCQRIYDPLWEQLIALEKKEYDLIAAINELSFRSFEDEQANSKTTESGPGKPDRRRKEFKAPRSVAVITAAILKEQGEALKTLMQNQAMIKTETELLRSQLWREVKSQRTARAVDVMEKL